jgi:hypothetical protein
MVPDGLWAVASPFTCGTPASMTRGLAGTGWIAMIRTPAQNTANATVLLLSPRLPASRGSRQPSTTRLERSGQQHHFFL